MAVFGTLVSGSVASGATGQGYLRGALEFFKDIGYELKYVGNGLIGNRHIGNVYMEELYAPPVADKNTVNLVVNNDRASGYYPVALNHPSGGWMPGQSEVNSRIGIQRGDDVARWAATAIRKSITYPASLAVGGRGLFAAGKWALMTDTGRQVTYRVMQGLAELQGMPGIGSSAAQRILGEYSRADAVIGTSAVPRQGVVSPVQKVLQNP